MNPELITENDVVHAIMKKLKKAGIWHWKTWGGGKYGKKNIADILGIFKVKVSDLQLLGVDQVGVFLAIEVKKPGKKPTMEQSRWLQIVRENGGIGMWADSEHLVVKHLGLNEGSLPLEKCTSGVIGDIFTGGE